MSRKRRTARNVKPRRLTLEQLEARRLMTVAPDHFESNDTVAAAVDLGAVAGLKLEPGLSIHANADGSDNPDYYRFRMTERGGAGDRVELQFLHRTGDIDLRLRNAAGDILDNSASVTDNEQISLAGRSAGEYIVEVYGWADATNQYDLVLKTPQSQGDVFEPNETLLQAADLGELTSSQLWSQLSIHADASGEDRDFYRFAMTSPGGPNDFVETRFAHANGDIDMRLLDANGRVLERSTSVTDNERISLNGRPAGQYGIEVYGWNNAVNSYSLSIDPPESVSTALDRMEPNDSPTAATQLGVVAGPAQWTNLTVHRDGSRNNADYFQFEIADTGDAANYVAIAFDHDMGDLDMQLLDTAGNRIASSAGWENTERISLAGLGAGAYVVHVYGYRNASNHYTLTIDGPQQAVVGADDFEPNDSRENAHDLGVVRGAMRLAPLSIHRSGEASNADYFRIQTAAAGTSEDFVEIGFSHTDGDLDIALLDQSGNRLDSSTSITDNERISLNGRAAGVYFVRVYGYDNAVANYSLSVHAAEAASDEDRFEPNDSLVAASNLRTIEGELDIDSLNIHAGPNGDANPDFFRFELGAEGRSGNFVGINFRHADGDLDLALLNAAGERLSASASITNNERISLNGLSPGVYFAHVYGYQEATADYSLHFDAPQVGGVAPDLFEENDSFQTAMDLREVTTRQALLDVTLHTTDGAPDVDYYRFELVGAANSGHYVDAEFAHHDLNIDLELFDASFSGIRSSRTTTDNERISLAGLGPGVYYARVAGAVPGQAVYDFAVRGPAAGGVRPDAHEPNDSAGAATDLRTIEGALQVNELTIHADNRGDGNDDYFRFETLAEGGTNDFVQITFDDSIGNLDMVLLDDRGNVVDRSQTHSDNERISLAGREAGVYYVRVVGRLDSTAPYQLSIVAPPRRPTADFELSLRFVDQRLSPSQRQAFETAAERWSQIIVADIPDVRLPTRFFGDVVVDDVLIDVSAPAIDGENGILGQAGPVVLRRGSNLPAYGIMQFDSADLDALEREGQLVNVILHEMGHVLGIGTIWEQNELVSGIGGANPRFRGDNARHEYGALRNTGPIDVPVENRGPRGTRDAHWRESTFDHELMTGVLDRGQNPLSRLTIAQLQDLGYSVDINAADDYRLPVASLADDDGAEEHVEMHNDVLDFEPIFVSAGEIDVALSAIEPDAFEGLSPILRADGVFDALTLHNPDGFGGRGDQADRFEFITSDIGGEHDALRVTAHDPRWTIHIELVDAGGLTRSEAITDDRGEAVISLEGLTAGHYTLQVQGDFNLYSLEVNAPFALEAIDHRPQLVGIAPQLRQSANSLGWAPITGAEHYELQVDALTAGVSNWLETTTSDPEWRPDSRLAPGEYQARVRVVDASGDVSTWSEYQSFTILGDRFNENNEVDVNADGRFNIIDAMSAIDYFRSVIAQQTSSEDLFGVAYADVDNSGAVSIRDLMTIIDGVRQQFSPLGAGDISDLPIIEPVEFASQFAGLRSTPDHNDSSPDQSAPDHLNAGGPGPAQVFALGRPRHAPHDVWDSEPSYASPALTKRPTDDTIVDQFFAEDDRFGDREVWMGDASSQGDVADEAFWAEFGLDHKTRFNATKLACR